MEAVDSTVTESMSTISTPQSCHESSDSPTPFSNVASTSCDILNVSEKPEAEEESSCPPPSQDDPATADKEEEEEEECVVQLPTKKERFYFESDALALKNNPDYQKLLKTLAVLEAQKMQAIRDLEILAQAQAKAERDPMKFVESLKNGTLEPLPQRQQVAELPDIEWKGYMESLQQVAKQHSSIYLNTRRQNKPLIAELNEKPTSTLNQSASKVNKPASYRQPWTPEEQARLEELLKLYPPERVERRRFQKIAKALGTRTTQQVASHIQKYFIKLAHAGLPVPGRMPNMAKYTRSRKGKGRRGLRRPSTFFSSMTPHVFMTEESVASSSVSGTPSVEGSSCHDEESSGGEDSDSASELLSSDILVGDEGGSGHSTPQLAVKCVSCETEIRHGVYWQCSECPEQSPTHLCANCINNDYSGRSHSPSHDLQLVSLGSQEGRGSAVLDKDYTAFNTVAAQTRYNYLDPNFFPANT